MAAAQHMTLWKSPSGRLHLYPTCSGAGPRKRVVKVSVTRAQYDAKFPHFICRCAWRGGWRSDAEREAASAGRLAAARGQAQQGLRKQLAALRRQQGR